LRGRLIREAGGAHPYKHFDVHGLPMSRLRLVIRHGPLTELLASLC